jgi:hypothetical protein
LAEATDRKVRIVCPDPSTAALTVKQHTIPRITKFAGRGSQPSLIERHRGRGTSKRSAARTFNRVEALLHRVELDGGIGRIAIMPTWRADYFDNSKDGAPSRSEIIVAENESDALHEARSKMGSPCSRTEVIPLEVTGL